MITLTKGPPPLEAELLSRIINRPRPDRGHTNLHKSSRPFSNEFQDLVATDLAPPGSVGLPGHAFALCPGHYVVTLQRR